MQPPSGTASRLIELVSVILTDVTVARLSEKKIEEVPFINIGASRYRSLVDLHSRPSAIVDGVESITNKVVEIINHLEKRLFSETEVGKAQIVLSIHHLRNSCEGNLNNSRLIKSAAYKFVLDRLSSLEK